MVIIDILSIFQNQWNITSSMSLDSILTTIHYNHVLCWCVQLCPHPLVTTSLFHQYCYHMSSFCNFILSLLDFYNKSFYNSVMWSKRISRPKILVEFVLLGQKVIFSIWARYSLRVDEDLSHRVHLPLKLKYSPLRYNNTVPTKSSSSGGDQVSPKGGLGSPTGSYSIYLLHTLVSCGLELFSNYPTEGCSPLALSGATVSPQKYCAVNDYDYKSISAILI